jgi:hypothetical protein
MSPGELPLPASNLIFPNFFDYWLNIIKLLSDEAPVLIVLNKVDQNIKLKG